MTFPFLISKPSLSQLLIRLIKTVLQGTNNSLFRSVRFEKRKISSLRANQTLWIEEYYKMNEIQNINNNNTHANAHVPVNTAGQ